MSDQPAFGQADLSNCERELIHLAGSVQPHGLLLVLHGPELTVAQLSNNTAAHLGLAPAELLHRPLQAVLPVLAHKLQPLIQEPLTEALPFQCELSVRGQPSLFDGALHRQQGCLLLELEPVLQTVPSVALPSEQLVAHLEESVQRVSAATTLGTLCDAVVRRVRDFTGYDRVMVYRFDRDGHGKIVAEARNPRLEPLLGHHYPATDIPQRARELYLRNRVRVLVDVNCAPAPLEPAQAPETAGALDMSLCQLRSMSPLHLQYLKNMGVTATLVVSLVRDGQLWGLIACHHYSPRHLSLPVRAAADLLGEVVATRITAIESYAHAQVAMQVRRLEQRLVEATSTEGDWRMALFRNPQTLLQPVDASGAVLFYDGEIMTAGDVPSTPELRALHTWAQARLSDGLLSCNSIARAEPTLNSLTALASGVLAVPLSSTGADMLVWFRKEQLQTITWAGDPQKPMVASNPLELSPRSSFAAWSEIVRGTALPWTLGEQALARAIGHALTHIILQVNAVRFLIAEHHLAKTRDKVAAAQAAVLVLDTDMRVLHANDALFALARQPRVSASALPDLAHLVADLPALHRTLALLTQERHPWQGSWLLTPPEGPSVLVALRAEVVPARDGSLLGFFLVFDDLSDSQRADAARQRLDQALTQGAQQINTVQQPPDTLMSAMLASASMAAMDIADSRAMPIIADLLDEVDQSTRRAVALYDRIRRFSAG
ncbi:MAG: GAF domain-containing protein [Hydrogenophaga sp.]|nr:GAF domain-containing protein [Hydrogenophaga sp.]